MSEVVGALELTVLESHDEDCYVVMWWCRECGLLYREGRKVADEKENVTT
jgi:hypothetical protein